MVQNSDLTLEGQRFWDDIVKVLEGHSRGTGGSEQSASCQTLYAEREDKIMLCQTTGNFKWRREMHKRKLSLFRKATRLMPLSVLRLK